MWVGEPGFHLMSTDWWNPQSWIQSIGSLIGSAAGAATAVPRAIGGLLTVLEGLLRLFTDTGHFVQDAVGWLPDAWGHLSLPETAATVRQVVVALTDGDDPPRPVHASTAALACYPEARETSEYSRTEIERLATYLRAHYAFSVIDMSNRLPDATGGPEASVAAYWLEQADALLLPTASSKQEFNGVLDYLDVQGLPPTVVAFLVPRTRRNREHPLTKRYLEAVTQRVCSVVPLPDESERVRYAVMEGIPAQDVSPSLRAAYRRLTASIARAPARVST
jgi:hypothetical protein